MKKAVVALLAVACLCALVFAGPGSIGKVVVTSAGTKVRFTATSTEAQTISVTALDTNAGKVYVGTSTLNKTTLAGVIVILQPGATFSWSAGTNSNPLNLSDYYVDADTNNDAIVVGYIAY